MIWTDRRDRSWPLTFEYSVIGGRVECSLITIKPPEGTPIQATDIRHIPVGALIAEGRRRGLDLDKLSLGWPDLSKAQRADIKRRLPGHDRGKPGRPGLSIDTLEQVAKIYTEAYRNGDYPTKAVADELNISRSTASKWVMKTRAVGLLKPTTQRHAGGVPTSPLKSRRTTKKKAGEA